MSTRVEHTTELPAPVDVVLGYQTRLVPPPRRTLRARIVRPAAPSLNTAALFTIVVLTIATVGLLYLVQTSRVAGLGYEVTRLEQERTAQALENQRLSYEVARLQALPAIEQVAVGQLGMQPVEDFIFLTVPVPPDDGVPQATAAPTPERSILGRVWDRLLGRGAATHAAGDEAGP